MSQGIFITFEGGEGTGKTTQIALLAKRLRRLNKSVITTREPGGTPLGIEIRGFLVSHTDDPPSPRAELLLYAADRAQHVEKLIAPALKKGDVVLCDRYADATEAYQGYGRFLDKGLIKQLAETATGGLWPTRTLWFDLPPLLGVRRSIERNSGEVVAESRFEDEDIDFHKRVHEGYAAICEREPGRVKRVDAEGSIPQVEARVWDALKELLGG